MITNSESGTRVDEIAPGIHRISTPVPPSAMPGGFSFNQYLVLDEEPLLFHTGMRSLFPFVSQAVAALIPIERLRYLALSHFESDDAAPSMTSCRPLRQCRGCAARSRAASPWATSPRAAPRACRWREPATRSPTLTCSIRRTCRTTGRPG